MSEIQEIGSRIVRGYKKLDNKIAELIGYHESAVGTIGFHFLAPLIVLGGAAYIGGNT